VGPGPKLFSRTDTETGFRVAVVGGGFGGIAAGVMLRRAGIEHFDIFERSAGVGGTWWDNRYPGAEVDTPSFIYSFSFDRYVWRRTHAQREEIQEYLERTVDEQGLRQHLQLGVTVDSAVWDDTRHEYDVSLADGRRLRYHALISAVGFLNKPRMPSWPGACRFNGQIVHTALWPEALELAGKRVAVVGTGSTSVQLVSELAPKVARLTVFQRQPNWVLPKGARDYTERERHRYRRPWRYWLAWARQFVKSESGRFGGHEATVGKGANRRRRDAALAHLREQLEDRPDLLELVTPDYPFFGKRPVINDTYYPALLRDNVTLVPHPVAAVDQRGVTDSTGTCHEVDVVVAATGFEAANYLSSLRITGRGGVDLHEHWNGEPEAFLGVMVPRFPNFFMLYGPNTNAGPVVLFLECQARFAASCIRRAVRLGGARVEVKTAWASGYNRLLQRRLSSTVWGSTDNYFKSASGRVVTQWPSSASVYWLLARILRPLGTTYTRRSGASHPRVSPSSPHEHSHTDPQHLDAVDDGSAVETDHADGSVGQRWPDGFQLDVSGHGDPRPKRSRP